MEVIIFMISKLITILFFPLILAIALTAFGQEISHNPKEASFEVGKEEHIKDWLVIGPFPNEPEADFLKSYGGETNIRPYEGMTITATDGKTYTWKRYKSESHLINLLSAISGGREEAVFYVACNILSPKDQRLEMLFRTDHGVRIWLNGNGILINPSSLEIWPAMHDELLPITLKKGVNHCLVKVWQVTGVSGFALRILEERGYLSSIRLDVSVRREKRNSQDVLSITARRLPKSAIFQLPSFPLPVMIEIRDEAEKLLATLKSSEEKAVNWIVPEDVGGALSIIAKLKDSLGVMREAKFTCKAHNIVKVTPKVGRWETYSVANGLGGSGVMSIVQDRNGFLWFGTWDGGVSRYDGRRFKTFTKEDGLPSNNVWVTFEDSKGNLWFGTMNIWTQKGSGVCKYDGKTFKTFTTKDGLVNDAVIAIYEDDRGRLWFGTVNGVSEFDGKTFRNYTAEKGFPSGMVGAIAQDKNGNLWFGHGNKNWIGGSGATRYDGKSFKHFTTQDGLVNNDVTSITTDAQGNLWFGTNGGVSKLERSDNPDPSGYDGKSFQNFTTSEGLVNNWVNCAFQTKNGDLWFGTFSGASLYRDGKFHSFTTKDGLAGDLVFGIAEDREGNLWFGTWGGVSRYDGSVESIPVAMGVICIRDTKGNLWFHVPGVGLGRYDGKNFQTFALEYGLLDTYIRSICEDRKGNIWVGSFSGGLAKYDGEKFQTFTTKDGLSSDGAWAIREDRKGILWIGTQGSGVYTYDGVKFVHVAGRKELGGLWTWVTYIIEDRKGNMWFATLNAGVCRYDGVKFTRFTTENGLPNNTSYSLAEDRKGNIWIATLGGACRYDGKTFRTFTTKDGLASDLINFISEDSQGNLWLGVETGGVYKFDGKNFQRFTTDDGLLNNTVVGIMEYKKGNIIFGASSGTTIYTPPKEKIPPPIYLTEVVADKVYPVNPSAPPLPPNFGGERGAEGFKIPSTTPRISFAYHSISFKTKRMRYNYMLEGYDKDWNATWDEEVSYDNLKSGSYVFKVIAINRDVVYSETPATVHLTIALPWYLNGWIMFPSLGSLSAMLFVAFYFGKRLQTQRAIALQFNPYIAGRVVEGDMFFGRNDLITDIERTLHNNCFLIYGERRIGKTSLQHQLKERLQNADDPTYRFIPAYIDL